MVGSSAADRGVATRVLAEELGASVLTLAAAGTAYPEQHLILELFTSRAGARTLLFQVDTWGLSHQGYSYPFHEYFYLPHLDNEVIRSRLTDYYGERQVALWRWVPMLKYAEFNSHIGIKNGFDRLRGRPAYDPTEQQLHEGPGAFASEREPFFYRWNPRRALYFQRILDLAAARKMDVVLLLVPVHEHFSDLELNGEAAARYYRDHAQRRGVRLFVFDDPGFRRDRGNFANWTHLNRRGAERYTRALATFLRATRR